MSLSISKDLSHFSTYVIYIPYMPLAFIMSSSQVESILPKGPYLPCESMAGRALLAGNPRCDNEILTSKWQQNIRLQHDNCIWLFTWLPSFKVSSHSNGKFILLKLLWVKAKECCHGNIHEIHHIASVTLYHISIHIVKTSKLLRVLCCTYNQQPAGSYNMWYHPPQKFILDINLTKLYLSITYF